MRAMKDLQMFRRTPRLSVRVPEVSATLRTFLVVAVGFALILAVASSHTFATTALPLAIFAITVTIAGYGLQRGYAHPQLGLCNVVTLSRAAMVAFIAGAVPLAASLPEAAVWLVFAVALLAFALDGADGWLARRSGLVSDFGARFDMEVDAGLAAVLSYYLWASGTTGPEILLLGLMRYAFVGASFMWPALQAPLPQAFRRKAVCVVQIAALILLMVPPMPDVLVTPVVAAAVLLLAWSFAVDVIWLARKAA